MDDATRTGYRGAQRARSTGGDKPGAALDRGLLGLLALLLLLLDLL